jgi:hypothetical protein
MADKTDFDRERLPSGDKTGLLTYPGTNNALGGLIQSPDLDKEGKPRQRAIKDAGMARNVINTVIAANVNRNIVYNRISAKYSAERPFNQSKLEAEGLGWKQNFTTKPLPMMVEKVAPRFAEAIQGMKHLTDASLDTKWLQSREKTEYFRTEFTSLCRNHPEWRTLIDDISLENSLFGHNVCAWLDEFGWFPYSFKHDEAFLTDGTKQVVSNAQIVVLKETYLPHELYKHIEDSESAKAAGWNIENCIKAINAASPAQLRQELLGSANTQSWYVNAVRELTVGASYMAGASVITVYSLLVREVNGKVSHYRLGGLPELDEIFSRDDRFENTTECLAFYTYQKGNGTMHGSKGLGRDIYELAGAIDRARNEVVDRAILSGKTLIQGDPRNLHKFRMSIVGAACIIPAGWTVLSEKIDGNIEPFLKLDAYFSMLADQLVGSVSVPQLPQGEAYRSPAAWNLMAMREEENRDSKIVRFLEQFKLMLTTMQRRSCDPDTNEADAKEFQKRLLTRMSREEITELSEQTVAETIADLTPMQRQMVVSIAQEKAGNPLYNHRQLEVEDLTSRVDEEFAKRVLLPDQDPTMTAEQTRTQQFELALITSGQAVPVSPRDDHLTHLGVLMPVAEQIGQALMEGQIETNVFEALLAHMNEHYNYAKTFKAAPDILTAVGELLGKANAALSKLKATDEEAAQLQSESQALDEAEAADAEGGVPMDAGGGPPVAPGPPTM